MIAFSFQSQQTYLSWVDPCFFSLSTYVYCFARVALDKILIKYFFSKLSLYLSSGKSAERARALYKSSRKTRGRRSGLRALLFLFLSLALVNYRLRTRESTGKCKFLREHFFPPKFGSET